ncbi:hypothetical protein BC941DRAFT_168224 [Chlamydoabsidia padenii]|nr:hypothetical protein BC941DRAFT_168224 [Chlamydoabsidia padenii]
MIAVILLVLVKSSSKTVLPPNTLFAWTLRLGITSKRDTDKWHLDGCLAFMIFLVCKQHKHLYTMTEIGAMTVASSLSDPHSFAPLMDLVMLSKISCCFWNHCNATPNVESSGTDDSSHLRLLCSH